MSCLSDAELQELRTIGATMPRCCDGERRCPHCRLLDGIDLLCTELELRRWGEPVVSVHEACSEQTRRLVAASATLVEVLGHHTPMTVAGHAALSRLRDASDAVRRWVLKPTHRHTLSN
jgi:hypothetical protein